MTAAAFLSAPGLPWTDRGGRFSPLKAAVFLATLVPAVWILIQAGAGLLGPRALNEAIHQTGDWSVRFLLASLAVSPARRLFDLPRLILVRRMLGLAGLAYALAHLGLYMADLEWAIGKIASEIVLRVYLAIGFVALVGLLALGATSTDGMIRRMGRSWHRLHRLVYPLTVLTLVHFFLQSKVDISKANLMAGLFVLLMAYRLPRGGGAALSPLRLTALAVAAGLATVAIETAWYGLGTGVPAQAILAANLDLSAMIRPAWWVAATGLAVAVVASLRRRAPSSGRGRRAMA